MQVILHIGMPKTGTTSIQGAFKASYDYLAENGVLFPKNPDGFKFPSHKIVASAFLPVSRYGSDLKALTKNGLLTDQHFETFHKNLLQQVSERSIKHMILSAEHFSSGKLDLAGLDQYLSTFGHVSNVVMYARKPSSWALSALQQGLKVRNKTSLRVRNCLTLYRIYSDFFGNDRVSAHSSDRESLIDGDIITDFVSKFLADSRISRDMIKNSKKENQTLSFESIALLVWIRNHLGYSNSQNIRPFNRQIIDILRKAEAAIGHRKPRFQDGVSDRINYHSTWPLALRDEAQVVFEDFDYGRLERGNLAASLPDATELNDLVILDTEYRRALAQQVAMEPLVRQDNALEDVVLSALGSDEFRISLSEVQAC